jgi:hypothetical protein
MHNSSRIAVYCLTVDQSILCHTLTSPPLLLVLAVALCQESDTQVTHEIYTSETYSRLCRSRYLFCGRVVLYKR